MQDTGKSAGLYLAGMRMKPRGSPTKQALLPSPSQRHLEIDNNQCRQSMVSPETTMRRDSHDDDS